MAMQLVVDLAYVLECHKAPPDAISGGALWHQWRRTRSRSVISHPLVVCVVGAVEQVREGVGGLALSRRRVPVGPSQIQWDFGEMEFCELVEWGVVRMPGAGVHGGLGMW